MELLLHPLPLDGSIFSDDLRSLVDDCVAPTLYDEGPDLAAWAIAALDAVGDGPVVVVGNSIGGSCATEVALLAPTRVKALVYHSGRFARSTVSVTTLRSRPPQL